MGRSKAVTGPKPNARNFENEKMEARNGVEIFTQMTRFSRPSFERTA